MATAAQSAYLYTPAGWERLDEQYKAFLLEFDQETMRAYEHYPHAIGFMKYSDITTINGEQARYGIFVRRDDIACTLRLIVFEASGDRCQLLWADENESDIVKSCSGYYHAGPMSDSYSRA